MPSVTFLSTQRSRLDPRTFHVIFAVDEVGLGRVSLPVFSFSPVTAILKSAPYSSSSTYYSYWMDKRAKIGKLPKEMLFRKLENIRQKTTFGSFVKGFIYRSPKTVKG